jgi:translation initiation factor 2 gamma subunit (eIF-2gamma)
MNNSKIKARLTELRNQMMSPSIMSAQERLELLSRMARGEERERIVQFVEGERFEYEIPASLKTRREAIDTMNKMTGEYVQKIAADIDTNVTINIELSDDE